MFKVIIKTASGLQSEQLFNAFAKALAYARKQYDSVLVYSVLIRRVA
jgi:hypothetical protein